MAVTRRDLGGILKGGDSLAQLILGNQTKQEQASQQGDIDAVNTRAKLQQQAQLDAENMSARQQQAHELDRASMAANLEMAQQEAARQGLRPGKYSLSANQSGFGLNPEAADPLKKLLQPLTPAQEAAEKAAGKSIADWETAGGRPTMEKNLASLASVEADLAKDATNGRNDWDRVVGGSLSSFPTLMGFLAPSEKARRDRARSTANNVARQSDPNPTEKQIENIMGQIYDPSSDNAGNLSKIAAFKQQQQAQANQMEQASRNYKATGYATLNGGGGSAASAPLTFEQWKAAKKAGKL